MGELLVDFLADAKAHLAELEVALGRLGVAPGGAAALSRSLRAVRAIQSACGQLGLARLEWIAHAGERVLGRMRDGELAVSADALGLLRAIAERIREIVSGLAVAAGEAAGDDRALAAALDAFAAGETAPAEPRPAPAATVCVPAEVLEDLVTRMGELVLSGNRLFPIAPGRQNDGAAAALRRFGRIAAEVQSAAVKARQQPAGIAWSQLPGLVGALARGLGKKIEFSSVGDETGLDHLLVERIKEPLAALVRASAEHGIEGPAERRGRGKGESGRITLSAYHVSGHVVIEIADDGRGLAVERACAGGGGLDAAITGIETVGGTFDVESVAGEGTIFTVRIPATLAVVPALIVESAGERFAIPRINVLALVPAGAGVRSGIEHPDAAAVLRLREQHLQLIRLESLVALEAGGREHEQRSIVVLQAGSARFGVIVDRVLEPEEVVARPCSPVLRAVTVFAGSTVLGDGSAAVILDPCTIARAGGLGPCGGHRRAAAEDVAAAPTRGRTLTGRG
ncbi:MAG: chemotaxis protein CheA [Acetobacteraceae bacterium]